MKDTDRCKAVIDYLKGKQDMGLAINILKDLHNSLQLLEFIRNNLVYEDGRYFINITDSNDKQMIDTWVALK